MINDMIAALFSCNLFMATMTAQEKTIDKKVKKFTMETFVCGCAILHVCHVTKVTKWQTSLHSYMSNIILAIYISINIAKKN